MKVLFVCTGNICRSPLAAALAAERGVEAASAGTHAVDGAPATAEAQAVAAERGLDISSHRARPLTRELVEWADAVLVMAERHLPRVEELGGAGKARLLAGEDVPDPIGLGIEHYRRSADVIEKALAR